MSTTQTVQSCTAVDWYCMLLFYGWRLVVYLQVVGLTCIRTVAAVFRLMRYRWLVRSIVSLNGECVYWPYVHLQAAYTINVVKPLGCRWRIAPAHGQHHHRCRLRFADQSCRWHPTAEQFQTLHSCIYRCLEHIRVLLHGAVQSCCWR